MFLDFHTDLGVPGLFCLLLQYWEVSEAAGPRSQPSCCLRDLNLYALRDASKLLHPLVGLFLLRHRFAPVHPGIPGLHFHTKPCSQKLHDYSIPYFLYTSEKDPVELVHHSLERCYSRTLHGQFVKSFL